MSHIFYNETSRQMIVVENAYAMSTYLGSGADPIATAESMVQTMLSKPEEIEYCKPYKPEPDPELTPNEESPQPELPLKDQGPTPDPDGQPCKL